MNDVDRRNCYIGKGKAMLSRTSIFRDIQGVAVEMVDRVYRLPPLHGMFCAVIQHFLWENKRFIAVHAMPSVFSGKVSLK